MNPHESLLFAVISFQMDFISREQLIAAVNLWVLDKGKSLDDILLEQKAIGTEDRDLLLPLVSRHLSNHEGDVTRSIASIDPSSSLNKAIGSMEDEEIVQTLSLMTQNRSGDQSSVKGRGTQAELDDLVPRFRIIRPLAKGGLGEVFIARDSELNREVALKQIRVEMATEDESQSRFVMEAEITGGLEHPGIVPVYGLGKYQDGRPFYAMRFIRGSSLKDATKEFHSHSLGKKDFQGLEFRKLLGRFTDVCLAIQYAHSRGVVHRDLKPGNIMLGKYGETLVVDWGLAKVNDADSKEVESGEEKILVLSSVSGSQTLDGRAIGTPAYMPPEQAKGELSAIGTRSDVYSLGATLYYMLTGVAPFGGKDLKSLLDHVRRGDCSSPRQVDPNVPKPLSAVCMKAMAVDPADRFESPQILADEIERWLADEPVLSFKEPIQIRFSRWIKKNKLTVSNLVAILVLGLIAFAISTMLLNQANQKLEAANAQIKEEIIKVETANAKTVAINEFLIYDLLEQASPELNPYREKTTVMQLLDKAAKKIDSSDTLKDQPEVESDLRHTIGRTYYALGSLRLAENHLSLAYALRKKLYGDDYLKTIETLFGLVEVLSQREKNEEALKLVEPLLKVSIKICDSKSEIPIRSKMAKSVLLLRQSRYQEARQIGEELITDATNQFGEESGLASECRINLANILQITTSEFDKANELFTTSLDQLRKDAGPNSREYLGAKLKYADFLGIYARPRLAKTIVEEIVSIEEANLPLDHPDALNARIGLAAIQQILGELAPAARNLEKARELAEPSLGKDHFVSWLARGGLSQQKIVASNYVERSLGRKFLTDSEELSQENIATCVAKDWPVTHSDGFATRFTLAKVLVGRRKIAEAQELVDKSFAELKDKFGVQSVQTLKMGVAVASLKIGKGENQEALELLTPLMEFARETLPIESNARAYCALNMANALAGLQKIQEAKNYLLEFWQFCIQSEFTQSSDFEGVIRALASCASMQKEMGLLWSGKFEEQKFVKFTVTVPNTTTTVAVATPSDFVPKLELKNLRPGRCEHLRSIDGKVPFKLVLFALDKPVKGLEYKILATEMKRNKIGTQTEELDPNSNDDLQAGFKHKVIEIDVAANQYYDIDVTSDEFRPFVRIETESESVIESVAASRSGTTGPIRILRPQAEKIRIVVLGHKQDDEGKFELHSYSYEESEELLNKQASIPVED